MATNKDGEAKISRETWRQWRHARTQAKMWSERADKLRGKLEDEIGSNTVATINDVPVITWKETEKRNVFDQAAHKAAKPDCHAEFTVKKPGTRPFTEVENVDEDALDGYPDADDS